MAKRRGAKSAQLSKTMMMTELYGEDNFIDLGGGKFEVNGEQMYLTSPNRQLSVRHELVSDLASMGMKPAAIGRLVKQNPGKSDGGHYARLLRDPRLRERARKNIADVVDDAKEKLKAVVVKSAENIAQAVNDGDIGLSKYVLGTQGVTDKIATSSGNVNVNFGDWLGSVQNTKQIHDLTPEKTIDIANDTSVLPEPSGELLTGGNNA